MGRSEAIEEALAALKSAREIYTETQVDAAITRMAEAVTQVVQHDNPVVLAVMRGGVFTATELCRRLTFPYQFDFVHGTRYGDLLTGGELSWPVPPSANLAGRTVVVVDDILDRGLTLHALYEALQQLGVVAIYSAVLVSKAVGVSASRPEVDFVGLNVDDVYVFGCGMDYKGYWRGLPSLFALAS
ncbi:MAG: hypoxanthine-guanine phosphoribosyltransferase [Gammaproteobacteria bacterium]|nr:hypoxanthine-guanine phosphoribosyltransferase [Gammaproteobacteria bacterium]